MGKKKKGKDAEAAEDAKAPVGPERAASSGNALRIGIVITLVTLGPQVMPMVDSGSMDLTTAIYRAAMVSIGCGIGAYYVLRLIDDYRTQLDQKRKVDEAMAAIAELMQDHPPAAEQNPSSEASDRP